MVVPINPNLGPDRPRSLERVREEESGGTEQVENIQEGEELVVSTVTPIPIARKTVTKTKEVKYVVISIDQPRQF